MSMLFDKYAPEVCEERRRRIRVALAAWAYERYADPIMTDAQYDALARAVKPAMKTGHEKLDRFFKTKFGSHTGAWVHSHPELDRLDACLRRLHPSIGAVHA